MKQNAAQIKSGDTFNIRKNRNIVGKQHIAELVSEQIKDGDSIMLDASSTAVYVAKTLLEQGKKNLTVLTNSVEIILELLGRRIEGSLPEESQEKDPLHW